MELQAYTFTDVVVVTRILSQIAMIFDGNVFEAAAKACALLGIIIALFVGLFRGGQLTPSAFLWPVIVTIMMILPRVDLVIEDKNGGLSKVDDLPIGFAAPISIITQLGAGVGRLLTENLGLEDNAITMDNGHLVSLRAPLVYQQIITDPEMHADASQFSNGLSPAKDTILYVAECLAWSSKAPGAGTKLTALQTRNVSSLRVDSPLTKMASNGQTYECGDLFDALMNGFESADYQGKLNTAIGKHFGKYQDDTTTGPRYQAALASVISDLPSFYAAAAFSNALRFAPNHIAGAAGGGSQQAALEDALNQKREKNYGTAAVIFETITTSISFMEVWSFSIMPLVLLLLIAGSVGAKIGVKYFWMLVWVQLWYPTLLIVMAFLDAWLDAASTSSISTIARYNAFITEILRLQDTGYMSLTMATALSMFLVFGTSSALAASFQRDMTGQEHVDPKKNAPDTLARQPHHSFSSAYDHSAIMAGGAGGSLGIARDSNWLANITMSIGHGVTSAYTAQEAASFSGTGKLSTTRGHGISETSSSQQTATGSTVASTGWTASNSTQLGYGSATQGGIDAGSTHSAGQTTTDAVQGQANVGFRTPIGGAGVAYTHTQSGSESASNDLRYNMGRGLNTSESASVAGSQNASESTTDSKMDTSGYVIGTEKSERGQSGEEISWGGSESTSNSRQEMFFEKVGHEMKMTEVAAVMSKNPEALALQQEAVANARLGSQVDEFLEKNAGHLDQLFYGSTADAAKYAFASTYIMQGLGGPLYADDLENGQARRDAINAVSDDIVRFTYLGMERPGGIGEPSLANLGSYEDIDPGKVSDRFGSLEGRVNMDEGMIKNIVAGTPTLGSAQEYLTDMQTRIGMPFGEMSEGQLNGILSTQREYLDAQHGSIGNDQMNLGKAISETGSLGGALIAFGKDPTATKGKAYMEYYEDLARKSGSEFPDRISGSGAQMFDTLATMEERQIQDHLQGGTLPADTTLGRYMAMSGLAAQAYEFGDQAAASHFEGRLQNMREADPVLKETLSGGVIAAMGVGGFSRADYIRAEQEYMLGDMERTLSGQTGHDLNTEGRGVQWQNAPEGITRRGTMDGGGTTLPRGSKEDILLSYIGSLEAPRGYNDYELASTAAPPQPLTEMTIGEVKAWQSQRTPGVDTRAAGKYQITAQAWEKAMSGTGLTDRDEFSPQNQDRMGVALLNFRGYSSFADGSAGGDNASFGHRLSQEWAILPRMVGPKADESYYENVQGNKAGTSVESVNAVLDRARQAPSAFDRGRVVANAD